MRKIRLTGSVLPRVTRWAKMRPTGSSGLTWCRWRTRPYLSRLLKWGQLVMFPRPGLRPFYLSLTVRIPLSSSYLSQECPYAGIIFALSTWILPGQSQRNASLGPLWAGRWISLYVAGKVRISQEKPLLFLLIWAPLVLWQQFQAGGRNGRVVSSRWCCQESTHPQVWGRVIHSFPKTYWALTTYQALFQALKIYPWGSRQCLCHVELIF